MTLLAIMMAAVVPVFAGSFLGVSADAAIRDVVALLKYAQERAVTDAVVYRFCIDTATGEYWLEQQTEAGGELAFRETNEHQAERRRLPEGISVKIKGAMATAKADEYCIEMSPSGACGIATIALRQDRGLLANIATTGVAGRVKVSGK